MSEHSNKSVMKPNVRERKRKKVKERYNYEDSNNYARKVIN